MRAALSGQLHAFSGRLRFSQWCSASSAQFDLPFYLEYLAKWPEYCLVAEGPGGQVMGYILGKVEGRGENWHGHVTAVTVAPEYRCARLQSRCYVMRPHTQPLRSLSLSLLSCVASACTGSAPPLPLRVAAASIYLAPANKLSLASWFLVHTKTSPACSMETGSA